MARRRELLVRRAMIGKWERDLKEQWRMVDRRKCETKAEPITEKETPHGK